VHVITGTLQRSIHTTISNGGLTASVGPSVEYGLYEEFGSRGRGPHPFMRPAAEAVYPRFTDRMTALVKKGGG
jgi:HK97 gp10 family phage protein